jgi:protein SCO1/2
MAWWALAFWPAAAGAAEWLAKARYVCFGALPGGLPDAGGFIILFAGPGLLLVSMLAAFSDELREAIHAAAAARWLKLLSLGLVVAFVAELGWVGYRILAVRAQNRFEPEAAVAGPMPVNFQRLQKIPPSLELVDQLGRNVSWASYAGKPVIITFVFAHCATVCPLLVKDTLAAAQRLGTENVSLIFVTLDPWRDTPSSLPELAKRWKLPENGSLLSGSPEKVTALLDGFEVPRTRDAKSGDVAHPALVYIVDRQGLIAYSFTSPSSDWLTEAVRRLQ